LMKVQKELVKMPIWAMVMIEEAEKNRAREWQ
jgi:hypothetical protein